MSSESGSCYSALSGKGGGGLPDRNEGLAKTLEGTIQKV